MNQRFSQRDFIVQMCFCMAFCWGLVLLAQKERTVTEKPVCVQSPAPEVDVDMAQHKTENIVRFLFICNSVMVLKMRTL